MTTDPAATHQLLLDQLAAFLKESEQILADWDAYSDQHTDLDGWPHDEITYGLRAGRRDADTWRSFNRVRHAAKDLLATAQAQLRTLPASRIQSQWAWQLSALDDALDQLAALQEQWLQTREGLPSSAVPGTAAYDDALAERNDEAWHHLHQWSLHGQSVLDIHAAAQDEALFRTAPVLPSRAPAAPTQPRKAPGVRR
ncbi:MULTISPECIES: hypothetical protein [Streptomyces]|uniref:hypothetical protein n=1 Tax=Streptomyces TaxID=1883 RepID=UPI001CCD9BC3|nr:MULTISPECIES: hypothetical protein [Streptomyces]UBI40005.1 hypothetical protein K7I03_28435 [Streptomyces mobaraensis]UKW32586.1 hypothetical protein MCU78_28365 [Streptomyces sp. TYQ1024]